MRLISGKRTDPKSKKEPLSCVAYMKGRVPGERIVGIVWYSDRLYAVDYDRPEYDDDEAEFIAGEINDSLNIPTDVAASALDAVMFGWSSEHASLARLFALPPTA